MIPMDLMIWFRRSGNHTVTQMVFEVFYKCALHPSTSVEETTKQVFEMLQPYLKQAKQGDGNAARKSLIPLMMIVHSSTTMILLYRCSSNGTTWSWS
jgi:microcystin degradation protein MlrC